MLKITPSAPAFGVRGNVIAIDIGGTNIDIALADAGGGIVDMVRLATRAEAGPDQALERVCALALNLASRSLGVSGVPVVAHAAVCAGVIQSERVLMAPNLPGWENLALARRLERDLGVDQVAVLNDVRAGALAELRFGQLRGVDPGIYLSLGTGVAAALTVAGQVVTGAHQAAGEIGYMVPFAPTSAAGRWGAATLEEAVGGKALGDKASALLGDGVSSSALFTRRDPPSRALIEQTLLVLSTAVANLAVFVNPERIVVGGGMMASADVILPALDERLKLVVPFPPDLVPARFTQDASLHGAIALALDMAQGSALSVPLRSARPATPNVGLSRQRTHARAHNSAANPEEIESCS